MPTIKEQIMVKASTPHGKKENKKTTNAQNVCDSFGINKKQVIKYKRGNDLSVK